MQQCFFWNKDSVLLPVLRIRRMMYQIFLGLLDSDPDLDQDPDFFITNQK
jgi:hypothetical protein